MSPREKSNSSAYIQIHDPDVSVSEIMENIESRLKTRNISKEDIERITNLKFSPFIANSGRGFDPAYAANLFEKGISTPKFSNPKLWIMKGPLKWLLKKVVDFYSLLDKKLSENRVRAFFQVLNEIVMLRKNQKNLSEKLNEFYKEYSESKYISSMKYIQNIRYSPISVKVGFESDISPESEALLHLIVDAQPVLIYYPSDLVFLEYCNSRNIQYRVITPFEEDVNLIRRKVTEFVSTNEDDFPTQSVIFHANACLFSSSFWEGQLRSWKSRKQNTRFIIRIKESPESSWSPFLDCYPIQINISELGNYLKSIGYSNINIYEKDEWGWINVSFMHKAA